MSTLGIRWQISGIPASFITRGDTNGRYCVTFERDQVTLEQLEQIDWSHPQIQRLSDNAQEFGLPEGYGFQVADIRYLHQSRLFVVEVQTAQQYLGDVRDYQLQVEEANRTIAAQRDALAAQTAEIASAEAAMHNAYAEGVRRNG